MKQTYSIYALVNPKNNEVFYVGQTTMISARASAHASNSYSFETTRGRYIAKHKIKPQTVIIEQGEMSFQDALLKESFWANKMWEWGCPLTNSRRGLRTLTTKKSFFEQRQKYLTRSEHRILKNAAQKFGMVAEMHRLVKEEISRETLRTAMFSEYCHEGTAKILRDKIIPALKKKAS